MTIGMVILHSASYPPISDLPGTRQRLQSLTLASLARPVLTHLPYPGLNLIASLVLYSQVPSLKRKNSPLQRILYVQIVLPKRSRQLNPSLFQHSFCKKQSQVPTQVKSIRTNSLLSNQIELTTLQLLLLLGGEGQRKETEEYANGKPDRKAYHAKEEAQNGDRKDNVWL